MSGRACRRWLGEELVMAARRAGVDIANPTSCNRHAFVVGWLLGAAELPSAAQDELDALLFPNLRPELRAELGAVQAAGINAQADDVYVDAEGRRWRNGRLVES